MTRTTKEFKVARAIYDISRAEEEEYRPTPHWDRLAPTIQDIYLRMAKAAISELNAIEKSKGRT
jgi:hypothetical protein